MKHWFLFPLLLLSLLLTSCHKDDEPQTTPYIPLRWKTWLK